MHKIIVSIAFLLLAIPASAACPDSPTGYSYCLPIPIDADQVSGSGDLTDFVAPVDITNVVLKTVANSGHVQDGNDLRFQIGTTALKYELISYDGSTGHVVAWVRIPTLDYNDDTAVVLYYGKSGASGEDDAEGTWPSKFKTVNHFEDGTTLSLLDSTANSNDGTNSGTTATTGKIGGAVASSGASNYNYFPANSGLSITDDISISLWFKPASTINTGLGSYSSLLSKGGKYKLVYNQSGGVGGTGGCLIFQSIDGGGYQFDCSTQTTWTAGTWYHIVATYDGATKHIYVDGSEDSSHVRVGDIDSSTSDNLKLFTTEAADSQWLAGAVDELQITDTTVLSPDWIATMTASQGSPSTFFVAGSEDTTTGGGTTLPKFKVQAIIGIIFWRSAWLLDYWQ